MCPSLPSLSAVLPAGGELHLLYQPRIVLGTLKAHCVEALVRWVHPVEGTTPADHFIPLAEESGDIVPLGLWVLDRAVRQVAEWREIGVDLCVAINVSPAQLDHGGFPGAVKHVLDLYKVPARLVEIEITEAVAVNDEAGAARAMAELREIGVALAMDDFGKGAAGVSMLRWLPAHAVKLDKSLIDGLGRSGCAAISAELLLSALVEFTHRLGAVSVAEGVETHEQAALLHAMGCDQGQGFFFSVPVEGLDAARFGIPSECGARSWA